MKKVRDRLEKIAIMLIVVSLVGFVDVTPILNNEWFALDIEPHPKFI